MSQRSDEIPVPDYSRQLAFHELLAMARNEWLRDALVEAIDESHGDSLRSQLMEYVPAESHKLLSAAGIPDEYVFPTPAILQAKPTLVAYYRLLLGLPQKSFYGSGTQMGIFRTMESRGVVTTRQRQNLPRFCRAMSKAFQGLIAEMSPRLTPQDVHELPILTLGQQFQGGYNNLIGQNATDGVFLAIEEIADAHIIERSQGQFIVASEGGRKMIVERSHDPDVVFREVLDSGYRNRVVVEIKGGTDRSNQYNRVGEAEKSHLKAKDDGFNECWTLIRTTTLDLETARVESPSTNRWFDVAEVLARDGREWRRFKRQVEIALHLPATD